MSLFSFIHKKTTVAIDDDAIVDQIIQVYSEEFTAERKMVNYIEKYAKTEQQKQEVMASLEDFNKAHSNESMFNGFKKQLFGANKKGCMLTHLELAACYLICTNKFYPEVIIDMLWIDKDQFKRVIDSLEAKVIDYGYKLPSNYKVMQTIIRDFFRSNDNIEL